jgi:hypothetical protein
MECSKGPFHHLVSGLIRELIVPLSGRIVFGDYTTYVVDWGSHLFPHIRTSIPFPISHASPALIRSLAEIMLRHAKEGLPPRLASKKDSLGKYLAFKT